MVAELFDPSFLAQTYANFLKNHLFLVPFWEQIIGFESLLEL